MDLFASSHTNQYSHYHTLENRLHLGVLGLNIFNIFKTHQGGYVFLPSALVPYFCQFLAEHVTGKFRLLILVAAC